MPVAGGVGGSPRRKALYLSTALLAVSLIAIFIIHEPFIAYLALALLATSTAIYLLPEGGSRTTLVFPRSHPYFSFLRLENAASAPVTFLLLFSGINAAVHDWWALLLVLAAIRIPPEVILEHLAHRRRRDLLQDTGAVGNLSELGTRPMLSAGGFLFETRTRRRRMGRTLFNAWMIDSSLCKVFIPGLVEIRGITERVREGARVSIVGPSTDSMGIRAIKPVAAVVLPPGWQGEDHEWLEVVRGRLLKRRLASSVFGSVVFVATAIVLGLVVGQLSGYVDATPSAAAFALLASTFFWALGEKSSQESSSYDVRWYFEPGWSGLSDGARDRRMERLRRQVKSGEISRDYVDLIENADPGSL